MQSKIIQCLLIVCNIAVLAGMLSIIYLQNSACAVLVDENIKLRLQLNDPHHCVSVCADAFEKMGC